VRVGLVSAKGSPGATTAALALAAVTGGMVVEADPAGGDIECWAGRRGEPGLIRVAGVLRHAPAAAGVLAEHAIEVWPGVRAVLGPVGCEQSESTLIALGELLVTAVEAAEGWVLVDAGRWARSQRTARRLAGCDVVAVVMSPTAAGVAQAAKLVEPVRQVGVAPVVGVLVGEHGYRAAEIAEATGLPIVGQLPWDPRWVQTLVTVGASRLWRRSALARSARSLTMELERVAAPREVVTGD